MQFRSGIVHGNGSGIGLYVLDVVHEGVITLIRASRVYAAGPPSGTGIGLLAGLLLRSGLGLPEVIGLGAPTTDNSVPILHPHVPARARFHDTRS